MKNSFFSQTLAPLKNHIKIFKNQKLNANSQTPRQYTTFHQYTSFTKYLCLLRCGDISTFTPHFFCTSKFNLFDLRNTKIQIWQISSSRIIPNPKWTKRAQKIPNQSSSWLWNCCTHFWKMLPIGALIWLALIWLIWAQIAQPTSNHLKMTSGHCWSFSCKLSKPHGLVLNSGC